MGCQKLIYKPELRLYSSKKLRGRNGMYIYNYRYSFNGKENTEIANDGDYVDFGARIYDSRLGRWMSVDPLQAKYPGMSPYNFTANCPITLKDIDGRDFRYSVQGNVGEGLPVTISIETTVHLYGADAQKAIEMGSSYQASISRNIRVVKGDKVFMQSVIIKINVKYVIEKSEEAAKESVAKNPGDNMMKMDEKMDGCQMLENGSGDLGSGDKDISPVSPRIKGLSQMGGTRSNARDAVFKTKEHETMHEMFGLQDRDDPPTKLAQKGYEGTIMAYDDPFAMKIPESTFDDIAIHILSMTGGKQTTPYTPKGDNTSLPKRIHTQANIPVGGFEKKDTKVERSLKLIK